MQTLWYILFARRLRHLATRYPWIHRVADRFALWGLVVGVSIAVGGLVITTLVGGR